MKDTLEGDIESNWGTIEARLRKQFPKEMELLTLTSGMHKVHSDAVLNYKKKVGDRDLYEAPLWNHKSIATGTTADTKHLDDTEYYKTMQTSTTSLEDRTFGNMAKGSYVRTWEFVEAQQRAYNMSSSY